MLAASAAPPAPQVGTDPLTGASASLFSGEVVNTTLSASLNSQPMRALDTRLYYNYRRKDNNSNPTCFTPTAASGLRCGGGPCEPELFDYTKYNLGGEAYYKVNSDNRVGGGYHYYHTERGRPDFPKPSTTGISSNGRTAALTLWIAA